VPAERCNFQCKHVLPNLPRHLEALSLASAVQVPMKGGKMSVTNGTLIKQTSLPNVIIFTMLKVSLKHEV
jgi:hypothetical protein